MPRPGIEPGRPEWVTRFLGGSLCLFEYRGTVPGVGAGLGCEATPAPTSSGPPSAAHRFFSQRYPFLRASRDERDQFTGDLASLGQTHIGQAVSFGSVFSRHEDVADLGSLL